MLIFLSKCFLLSVLCNKYLFENFKFMPLWQKLAMAGSGHVGIGQRCRLWQQTAEGILDSPLWVRRVAICSG